MDADDCTVVAIGAGVERLFSGQRPVASLARVPDRDDVGELVGLLDAGGTPHVIAVVGEWIGEEAMVRVRAARSLLARDGVALVTSDLPPLALGVLAALAGACVAQTERPGALAAAIPALARELLVVAWLASVSRLSRPSPGLALHARSALPGAGFAAGLQPEPFVETVARRALAPPVVAPTEAMQLLVAAHADAGRAWILDVLNPALGSLPVLEVDPSTEARRWWGTDKVAEAVGAPTDLDALAARVAPQDLRACHWCAEAVRPESACPFCADATNVEAAPAPA